MRVRPRVGSRASVLLGALAVAFGIGLMTSAGYLIARAAERPAILSLTTVIVAVRFFGLARPIARYLERVVSHDLAFRVLARLRVRFYERIEPLAPAGLEAYRRGDLVSRMVGDVDTLQTLYLRGLGPPLVAILAGAAAVGVAAAILPVAAVVLAAGLLVGGVTVVVVAALLGRASGTRAVAQGKLSAELVELLRGAPELVVYGREEETLRRFREGDGALARLAHRDALAAGSADALGIVATGLTTIAVLAVAVSAHASGELDRTLVAALALLSLASFEAVALLPPRRASSRRCWIRTTRSRAHRPRAGGAGPARPTGDSTGHAGDRPGRRERPLLGRGATGAPARRSDPRARAEAGPGRPERGGEDDHRPPAPAVSRPLRGLCHARRSGSAAVPPGGRAERDRRRRAGRVPLLDEHP